MRISFPQINLCTPKTIAKVLKSGYIVHRTGHFTNDVDGPAIRLSPTG